jgi:hypothetical protein
MRRRNISKSILLLSGLLVVTAVTTTSGEIVDATSLRGKVLCGYNGWFRCPTDGANEGWIHWSRDKSEIRPETLTFEMWPDMTEYSEEEKYEVPGFTYPWGSQAHLFSGMNSRTVLRHFEWMQEYGIEGVWLSRFLVILPGGPGAWQYPSWQQVMYNVRDAASETGRVWAISYDMSGMPSSDIFSVLTADWKNLVDAGVTEDPRYLHHDGKPVLRVWGFFASAGNMTPAIGNDIVDFFRNDPQYGGVYLVGGTGWWWYMNTDADWMALHRSFDAIEGWNVGNYTTSNGKKWANTQVWEPSITEAESAGMLYVPVIYPGFSWDNLQQLPPGTSLIPREGGEFYWKQFHRATELGLDTIFVAMFDEVDEGTAIFKVTSQPPTQAYFVGYDGAPNDWYLRLTREATKMLRGERESVPRFRLDILFRMVRSRT